VTNSEVFNSLIRAGYTPIPLKPNDKIPAIEGWQNLIPTRVIEFGDSTENVVTVAMAASWSGFGVGVACGSGLTCIDVDTEDAGFIREALAFLPPTIAVRGAKGFKAFYRAYLRSEDFRLPDRTAVLQILGAGRQAAIPPSVHPGTKLQYAWVNPWGGPVHALGPVQWGQLPELPPLARWKLERLAVRYGCADPLLRLADRLALPETDPVDAAHIAANRAYYQNYAAKALRLEAETLAATKTGGRNDALFRASANLSRFVTAGLLQADEIERALWSACEVNGYLTDDGAGAWWQSFRSGISTGMHNAVARLHIPTHAEILANAPPAVIPAEALPAPVQLSNALLDLMDLRGVRSTGKFHHIPSGGFWTADVVDKSLPKIQGVKPSVWIMSNHAYNGITWAPGEPTEICGRYMVEGGWLGSEGAIILNTYRPPRIGLSRAPGSMKPWLDLLTMLYPDEVQEILYWFASRVQQPHVKINHALVLGGDPGIGKDTILEPLIEAVGRWNVAEISPRQILSDFNPWLESVILRVNEAADLEESRYRVSEAMKTIIAAPPLALSVNQKNVAARLIPNLTGVIYTTNHHDAIFMKNDDRRHLVCWSHVVRTREHDELCAAVWNWLLIENGIEKVATFLHNYDISAFKPYAPPRHTEAFRHMVQSDENEVDAQIEGVLGTMGNPVVVTLASIRTAARVFPELDAFMGSPKNDRSFARRMDRLGYVRLENPDNKSGRWKSNGTPYTVYGRKDKSTNERRNEAESLMDKIRKPPAFKIVEN
jgi:hypothetical protein